MTHEIEQLIHDINFNAHMICIYEHKAKVAQNDIYKALENVCITRQRVDILTDELHGMLFDLMLHLSYRKFMKILNRLQIV